MNSAILCAAALTLTLLALSAQGGRPNYCKVKPREVELDQEWLDSVGPEGFYVPMGSKLGKPNPNAPDLPKENMTLTTKRCWTVQVKSSAGALPVPLGCRYDGQPNKASCAMKTWGTALHKFARYFGDFTATMTDGKSFIVVFGCLQQYTDYWVALSVEKTLDEETQQIILDHVEEMGFSRTDLKSNKDALQIDRMRMIKCRKGKRLFPGLEELKKKAKEAVKKGKKAAKDKGVDDPNAGGESAGGEEEEPEGDNGAEAEE